MIKTIEDALIEYRKKLKTFLKKMPYDPVHLNMKEKNFIVNKAFDTCENGSDVDFVHNAITFSGIILNYLGSSAAQEQIKCFVLPQYQDEAKALLRRLQFILKQV